jgi:hypothetical protein
MNEHLKATLGLDNGPFVRGLRGARGAAMRFSDGLSGLGKIVAGSIFGTAVKSAIDFASTIKDVSETTGIASETLQAFRLKAETAAGSTEIADRALEKFTVTLGEALSGNDAAQKAFESLGVSLFDLRGKAKSNQQIFEDTVEALSKIKEPSERARLAVDLFGKSGVKLATSFEGGKKALKEFQEEAIRTGKILDEHAIDRLDRLDERFKRLKVNVMTGLSRFVAFMSTGFEGIYTFLKGLQEGLAQTKKGESFIEAMVRSLKNGLDEVYKNEMKLLEVKDKVVESAKSETEELEKQLKLARKKREEEEAAEAAKRGNTVTEAGKFSSIEDLLKRARELKESGAKLMPDLAQDAERAKLAQQYLSISEGFKGIDAAKSSEYFNAAQEIISRIGNLQDAAKLFGPRDVTKVNRTPPPKPTAKTGYDLEVEKANRELAIEQQKLKDFKDSLRPAPLTALQGGIYGGIESAINQAMQVADIGGMSQKAVEDRKFQNETLVSIKEQLEVIKSGITVYPKNAP